MSSASSDKTPQRADVKMASYRHGGPAHVQRTPREPTRKVAGSIQYRSILSSHWPVKYSTKFMPDPGRGGQPANRKVPEHPSALGAK